MKRSKIILTSLMGILLVALMISCYLLGSSRAKRIAVDFSLEEVNADETEPRYKHIPRQYSDYICSLCDELGIDSDLAVSIVMVENPEYNPEAISKPNTNGTLDLGLFQLNDYYLWTTFKDRYWFDNIELNPFNYKHNIYIALHHLKYLQDKLKVEDDVIMAYNGGEGNVMNGTVKPSTKVYLAKVKNNLYLLRGEK